MLHNASNGRPDRSHGQLGEQLQRAVQVCSVLAVPCLCNGRYLRIAAVRLGRS